LLIILKFYLRTLKSCIYLEISIAWLDKQPGNSQKSSLPERGAPEKRHFFAKRAQELLEVVPNYVWGHFLMAQIYEQQGQLEKAAQESLKADELFGTDAKKVARPKEAMAKSGAPGYWRFTLQNYRESAQSNYGHLCSLRKRACGLVIRSAHWNGWKRDSRNAMI
jgi:hypothetical protein